MQPVLSLDESRRVRTDAEALVVLDTTRSMLASSTPRSASRLARAKVVAAAVHEVLPTVPVGLASLTDRTLPHLFPSADGDVFRATLQKAIGIERPPPVHSFSTRITNLEALSAVATHGFYSPTARRRLLVVVTDGESLPGARARLAPLFTRAPGISSVFVHVWDRDERVFRGRTPEPGYRPDPGRAALARPPGRRGRGRGVRRERARERRGACVGPRRLRAVGRRGAEASRHRARAGLRRCGVRAARAAALAPRPVS